MDSDLVEGGRNRLHLVLVNLDLGARRLVAVALLDLVKNALLVAATERGHAVNEGLVEVEVA